MIEKCDMCKGNGIVTEPSIMVCPKCKGRVKFGSPEPKNNFWKPLKTACPYDGCEGNLFFVDKGVGIHEIVCDECTALFIREE